MCSAPDIEAPPPPAERQAMNVPQDAGSARGLNRKGRRGMWATVFTGPKGIATAPTVTGAMGATTGG